MYVKFVSKTQVCSEQSKGLFANIALILGYLPMYCGNTVKFKLVNIISTCQIMNVICWVKYFGLLKFTSVTIKCSACNYVEK